MKEETPEVVVHDHAHSVRAKYDDMLSESSLVSTFAGEVGDAAWDLRKVVADPDLVASAILDPTGAAKAEYELLNAINGPRGLLVLAVELKLRSIALSGAVDVYQARDRALARLEEIAVWGGVVVVAGAIASTAPWWMPAGVLDQAFNHGRGRAKLADLGEQWIVDHAHLTDEVVGGLPELLTGMAGLPFGGLVAPFTVKDGGGWLAAMLPDGKGRVTGCWRETRKQPIEQDRPLEGLMRRLAQRNADSTPGHVTIDVTKVVVTDANGRTTTRWIVDIPGTKELSDTSLTGNPVNARGNLTALTPVDTAYQQAIIEALHRAHVGRDDPVMLVGHSFGGRVAVLTAIDTQGVYNVTHVVTAGSHVSDLTTPDRLNVLSLENTGDYVPYVLGKDLNATGPHRVTVDFTVRSHKLGDPHDIGRTYVPGARGADANRTAALDEWRRSSAGFFQPGAIETMDVYSVERVTP